MGDATARAPGRDAKQGETPVTSLHDQGSRAAIIIRDVLDAARRN